MTARICIGLMLLGICVSARAADVTQTFNDAQVWGAQQQTSIPGQINPGTAQSKVPNYQSTSPATNNYGNGNTALFGLGSSKVSDCATNPTDQQYSSQECNAVNTVAQSPSQRPQFNLSKSDPIFQAGSSVINDPSQVAGSINGTYSDCTTKTTTSPAINDTETCDIYHPVQQQTCSKIDNVTVTNSGYTGCTPGQLVATQHISPFPTIYIYCPNSPGYTQVCFNGCCWNLANNQSYSLACGNMSNVPISTSTSGAQTCVKWYTTSCYSTLQNNVTVTDSWDDQCTTFEAAAQ